MLVLALLVLDCYNSPYMDIITEKLRGFELQFKTKAGVFSEKGLDSGTRILIGNMEVHDGTLVADLGSGTGVLGFFAAKLNPSGHVHLLEDHLRSAELAKENSELNNFKNVEVFFSDLFSAVGDRTYHLIVANPPAHLGNEFLEETASECFKHLKSKGEVWWVVPKYLKPVIERLFKKYFGNSTIVATGAQHFVVKGVKA